MAATIEPRNAGRRGRVGVTTNDDERYLIRDAADPQEVIDLVVGTAPATSSNGAPLAWVDYDEIDSEQGIWEGIAQYETKDLVSLLQPGDSAYSFDTTGGTQHLTHSYETVSISAKDQFAAGGATAFDQAINVDVNGRIGGVDVGVPVFNYEETHVFEDAQVTNTFKRNLMILTATMNSDLFKALESGENLFHGAAGGKRGDEKWQINFRFSALPNVPSLVVPSITIGDITVESKYGWDYLWVYCREKDKTVFGVKVLGLEALYAVVDRVHYFGDHSLLGIGT